MNKDPNPPPELDSLCAHCGFRAPMSKFEELHRKRSCSGNAIKGVLVCWMIFVVLMIIIGVYHGISSFMH